MVTGASGLLGRAIVTALRAHEPEVRAAVRSADVADELRALGAKVTVGRLGDAERLAEVCGGAHTLIHLVGGPNQVDEHEVDRANHGSVEVAVEAAREARVRRFVLLSVPGANEEAEDPFLRAKGRAESVVAGSGLEHVVLRVTHAYGVGGLWFTAVVHGALADPPLVLASGAVAPVAADDIAAVVAAADDRVEPLVGTFGLEGPDALGGEELLELLAGSGVVGTLARPDDTDRLSSLLGIPVSATAAAWICSEARADAPDAAEALGVRRTPLAEGLRRTLARASGR